MRHSPGNRSVVPLASEIGGLIYESDQRSGEWTYAHFPDNELGEWYGYLHRDGTVAQPAKGNLFKGPFHIPRMMVKAYSLCQEILNKEGWA